MEGHAVHEGLLVLPIDGLADPLVDAVLAHDDVVRVVAVEGLQDLSLQDPVDHGLDMLSNAHLEVSQLETASAASEGAHDGTCSSGHRPAIGASPCRSPPFRGNIPLAGSVRVP